MKIQESCHPTLGEWGLIGSMDFRWKGSVGFEGSVIPGGQGVFLARRPAQRLADHQERKGGT